MTDVRAQVGVVFHLDKCIGCHTCSVSCKNIWTDREGTEYMWWNNVETKPGTGFPIKWEDQEKYNGGWELVKDKLKLKKTDNKLQSLLQLFYDPNMPGLDDYYEPWTYKYEDLFNAPLSDDQPTAIPISKITGEQVEIKAGPNWDDDLGGSNLYAKNDPNLQSLSQDERDLMMEIENISMMYLPRICNHCVNPSCVAACPSGALYKRGEDGIVLVNQNKCRGWRACIVACPYKKMYYNWKTGKAEKCILCYPRLETGQPPSCFQSCVGRIRYLGVLLYDAEQIQEAMKVPEHSLVESQRKIILNPYDPKIIEAAKANGISDNFLDAACNSPVYKYVVEWKLALPLHPEYRTSPMLFYVPPLLPVLGKVVNRLYDHSAKEFFTSLEHARLSIKYLAKLFSAGNEEIITYALKKMMAVRYFKRMQQLGDLDNGKVYEIMREAYLTENEAEEIYKITSLATVNERFVLPPIQREEAMVTKEPEVCKGCTGYGEIKEPRRGF
ncbi:MAG: nitrate reductase subunit beta [Candidatus Melainabacteria bacterium]|nr:nitrate reductase subunit beta [Candidatus Melainabacteria bacterium]